MTARERLLNALRGEFPDRVPLVLEGFHLPRKDAEEEPAKREILDRVHEQLHFFVDVPTFVNRYLVTPPQRMKTVDRREENGNTTLTTAIDTPKGTLTAVTGHNTLTRTQWTIKYPVESLEDIAKIRSIPWERPPSLAPPDTTSLPEEFGRRGILRAGVSSPFVCVGGMMPFEYFLELCATELPLVRELTAVCLDRIMDVLDVVLAGDAVEYVWMGGCEWLTPPMGSPRLYEELVHDFEQPVIDRIHAHGALAHVHCHGNVRSSIELVIARGADFFEPMEPPPDGDITLAEAKALVAGRMTLGGNVEARVLENESAEDTERAARAAFENGTQRLVFQTTAGPLSLMNARTLRNYHRMIDVWEELSAAG
jgi:uroporphyrinogen-III decarboxylase